MLCLTYSVLSYSFITISAIPGAINGLLSTKQPVFCTAMVDQNYGLIELIIVVDLSNWVKFIESEELGLFFLHCDGFLVQQYYIAPWTGNFILKNSLLSGEYHQKSHWQRLCYASDPTNKRNSTAT